MALLVYSLYALAHLALLGWGARLWRRASGLGLALALLVVAALVYDNLIIAVGHMIGTGTPLAALSWPRFAMHAFLTPLLIVAAVELAGQAGLAWAQRPTVRGAAWLLAGAMVLLGVWHDLVGLTLIPESYGGTLRYRTPPGEAGPPIPAIVTVIVTLVVGGALWRARGWPALFAGSLVMFVASAIPPSLAGPALGSGGEVFLMLGFVALAARLAAPLPQRAAAPA